MNLGDLAGWAGKPISAMSYLVNRPTSAGPYGRFYLQKLVDEVKGRTLKEAVAGRRILITGGSSGIGEATAKKVARAGGEVVIVARTREKLDAVAESIAAAGGTAHVYPCDLSDVQAVSAMSDQVGDRRGRAPEAAASYRDSLDLRCSRRGSAAGRMDHGGHGFTTPPRKPPGQPSGAHRRRGR